ncbi:MAG: lytic murein transglycosylase, partial [Actinocatenispora sp.]
AAQPSGSPSPGASSSPPAGTGPTTLATWAASLQRLGISSVALQAYGYAELTTTQVTPTCHLTWTTLAGIGKIESNHGTHGTSQLAPDGVAEPPIYGPALDGSNDNKLIADSDGGKLDDDTTYDRAVGPMQFLPGTWARWGTDADGNGDADPQDINDAALSAARYLCANGHDLGTGAGWWQAIHSYNNLDKYASDVFAAADAYGVASRG